VRSLFELVQVGSLTLANRVFMAPLRRKGQSRPSGRELDVSEERNVYQQRHLPIHSVQDVAVPLRRQTFRFLQCLLVRSGPRIEHLKGNRRRTSSIYSEALKKENVREILVPVHFFHVPALVL